MQDVLDLLLLKGFSLQLKHEEKEIHNGFVTLFDSHGTKLAHSPKIQILYNSNRVKLVSSFVNECVESYQNEVGSVNHDNNNTSDEVTQFSAADIK